MNRASPVHRVLGALAAVLIWLCAFSAEGASFQISPTLAEVPAQSSVASFRVTNSGSEVLPIQIEGFAWTQDARGEHHAPATDLVIVPRIATIQPGKTQLIRVALRANTRERERAYRVHFIELPGTTPAGFVGVRTTVRFDVPLFFAASGAAPARLDWKVALDAGGALRAEATNSGGSYVRLTALRIVDARGALLAERKGPLYVLPGRTMSWPLTTHASLRRGDPVQLRMDGFAEKSSQPLIVQ